MSKCKICNKSVYFNDPKLNIDGAVYHSTCAKCEICDKKLSVSNFAMSGERILCKTHFKSEFSKDGGRYGGDDKFVKGSRSSSFD